MPHSRFATSYDGKKIAYRVYGDENPTILLSNGIGCHTVFLKYLVRDLSPNYRVIVWDYRGHNDSEAPDDPEAWTMDDCMMDMVAVMEASGTQKAVLGGYSMGVQMSCEFAHRYPEKALGIIALAGAYENPIKTFYHIGPVINPVFPLIQRLTALLPYLTKTAWKLVLGNPLAYYQARVFITNWGHLRREDFDEFRPHFMNINLVQFTRMLVNLSRHSAKPYLADLNIPMLIVAGDKDNFTPLQVNEEMHKKAPGSELAVIKGGTHATLLEFPESVADVTLDFLNRHFC